MNARRSILAAFIAHAIAGGGIFTRIPDIQENLRLSESLLGLAMTAGAAGGLFAMLFTGRILERTGTRTLLVWGVPLMAIFTAITAFSPTIETLFVFIILNGIAFSVVNVAMNLEADRYEAASGEKIMNFCHGVWSIGMVLAALVGGAARGASISAGLHLTLVIPVILFIAFRHLFAFQPSPVSDSGKDKAPLLALPDKYVVLLVLFGMSAGIAQISAQSWSVIFMRDTFTVPTWIESAALPAFLLTMAGGRLFADGWIRRFGPVRVATTLSLVGITGTLLVVISTSLFAALFGFAMIGLGTAVMFPLMITAAARHPKRPAAHSVSSVLLVTGFVMMVAPAIVGWIAETGGLRIAYAATLPPFILSLLLVRLAEPKR